LGESVVEERLEEMLGLAQRLALHRTQALLPRGFDFMAAQQPAQAFGQAFVEKDVH